MIKLNRKHRERKIEKIHTSIYLLPRHRSHLEFLMNSTGLSMTDCICSLIERSMRSQKIDKGQPNG